MSERIRALHKDDLPALVEMWNGTDSIWPGGLTSGMPLTLDRVAEWVGTTKYLTPYVAVLDGRIVGFCGLTPQQSEPDVAYISILGVHPDVLNMGYGRDLLRTAIARATDLGFRRLDLDTWSANNLAIPLYKRTGFFWVPGTSVNMQNFLPTLLRHPLVQRFLDGADWYGHFAPTVHLEEDRHVQGNLPVFPYVFRHDGAQLRVMVNVGTGAVVSYNDDKIDVSLVLDRPRLILHEPSLASVQIRRNGEGAMEPCDLSLFATGKGGVQASRTVTEEVGASATVEVPLVASRLARRSTLPEDIGRPGLSVNVAVGGTALTLGASTTVVPALEVVAHPEQVSLAPDKPGVFWLGLRNNLDVAVSAGVQLTSCGDFAIHPLGGLSFNLEPGSSSSTQVEVIAPAGLHSLRAVPTRANDGGSSTIVEAGMLEVPVVAGGPSDVYAYRTEAGAIVENAYLRALIEAKGGVMRLQTKNPTQDLVEQRANLGPPFSPSEFAYRVFDVQVDAREGRASVHMAIESAESPGLWFRRSITLTASPRVETDFSLVNTSDRVYSVQARAEHSMRLHASLVAVPLSEGLLVDSAEAADWEGGARFPTCYAETWACQQREDLTVGFLWPEGSFPEFSRRFGPVFTLPEVNVGPGETVAAGRVVLFGGTGGWRTVRDQWRRLFNPEAPEQPPAPVRAAQALLVPGVVAWSGDPVNLDLFVSHLRGRVMDAKVTMELPNDWEATADRWEVSGLRRGQVRRFQTSVLAAPRALYGAFPAAEEGRLVLDANLALGTQPLALLNIGDSGVEVKFDEADNGGYRTLVVDNGWASFTVAPQFAASVIRFDRDGTNHLYSPFPNTGSLMWQRPWFGGIAPVVAPGDTHFHPIHAGRLHEETFEVESPVWREAWGARWAGVRLSSVLKSVQGVRLEVDYFTLGMSNLLMAVVRLANVTAAPQSVQSFLGCYLRVDGEIERTVLRYLAEGEHNTRREAFDVWLAPSADWAAVESVPSGLTAALVSVTSGAYIQAYNLGLEGAHLFNVSDMTLAPGAVSEYVTLFVLTDGAAKARRYRALGWSGEIGRPPEH